MMDTLPPGSLDRPLSEIKAELFRALAHPVRVRVLELLLDGERSVGDLAQSAGVEQSHLSQQLAVLRRAALVSTRKEGSTVFYGLRGPAVGELLVAAKKVLISSLSETQELLAGLRVEAER